MTALLHLIFPPECLQCKSGMLTHKQLFCESCVQQLTLTHIEGRCKRCFADTEGRRCIRCMEQGSPFKRSLAAFEYAGPAAALIKQFKSAGKPELAKALAAWMVVQWSQLDLPIPDLIVPVPQPFLRWLSRGYNQSLLLAREMGLLLDRPVKNLLKRSSGDFPQVALSKSARQDLPVSSFGWKRRCEISDKTVLVVDDVMTTGSTLRRCAAVLEQGYPAALYAITGCIAE